MQDFNQSIASQEYGVSFGVPKTPRFILSFLRSRYIAHLLSSLIIVCSLFAFTAASFAAGTITNLTQADLMDAMEGGGTVVFAVDGTLYLTNALSVADNIILDSAGHDVTISGSNATRLFNIVTNGNLTLLDLKISDGRAQGAEGAEDAFGGAIYNEGTLTIGGCAFFDNAAIGAGNNPNVVTTKPGLAAGGAIWNVGTTLITDSAFTHNTATGGPFNSYGFFLSLKEPGGSSYGGAIHSAGGSLSLSNVWFTSNSVIGGSAPACHAIHQGGPGYGGAVSVLGGTCDGNLVRILTNSALGGGANAFGCSQLSLIGGSAFGGGFYVTNSAVWLETCVIAGNRAQGEIGRERPTGRGCGGGIANYGTVELDACEIVDNQALGAIPAGGGLYNFGQLLVAAGQIRSNRVIGESGHSGYDWCPDMSCYLFNRYGNGGGNGSPAFGGGLHNEGHATFNGCYIVENVVAGGAGGAGGAGFAGITNYWPRHPGGKGGDGSDGYGGGVYNSAVLAIHDSVISTNRAAGGEGGTAGIPQGTAVPGRMGSAFGAGIWNKGALSMSNAVVQFNSANSGPMGGGGINSSNSFVMTNSLVSSNSAVLSVNVLTNHFSVGSLGVFTVSGDVPDGEFNWFFENTPIAGAVDSTYSDASLESADAGSYSVRFSLDIATAAELRFASPPYIISQSGNATIDLFSNTTIAVQAVGNPLSYQWFFNGAAIPGATNRTHTFQALPQHAGNYFAVVENTLGNMTSAPIVLTMPPVAPIIMTQPQNATLLKGSNASLSVSVVATEPITFQWLLNGNAVAGATSSSYTPVALGHTIGDYSVIISNAYGSVTSIVASVSMRVIGDLNYDGRTDILFQHTNGSVVVWRMRGTNVIGTETPNGILSSLHTWNLIGLNDFSGNVSDMDLLWRKGTNFFILNRVAQPQTLNFSTSVATNWQYAGTGHVNSDSKPDILWQHTDGRLNVWFMNHNPTYDRISLAGSGALSRHPASGWKAMGMGDYNQDGATDIVFQHTDRRLAVWFMNGTNVVGAASLRRGEPSPLGWTLVGLNDLNDDGHPDLLWQTWDRRLVIWFMKKTSVHSSAILRNGQPVRPEWRVVGIR